MSLLLATFLIPCIAAAADHEGRLPQAPSHSTSSVKELSATLDTDPNAIHAINGLWNSGDREAIPALAEAFMRATNPIAKRQIAFAMLRLGEKKDLYWKELKQSAEASVQSKMPFPIDFDADGNAITGRYGKAFLAWCKENSIEPEDAARQALFELQDAVVLIARTNDPRAIPILLEGLRSPNPLVVTRAAQGLARLQHTPAIKQIIAACRRLHPKAASPVAEALLFFDDAEAHAAAKKFIRTREIYEQRLRQVKEHGPGALLDKIQ